MWDSLKVALGEGIRGKKDLGMTQRMFMEDNFIGDMGVPMDTFQND